jgi:hypothetical protein
MNFLHLHDHRPCFSDALAGTRRPAETAAESDRCPTLRPATLLPIRFRGRFPTVSGRLAARSIYGAINTASPGLFAG